MFYFVVSNYIAEKKKGSKQKSGRKPCERIINVHKMGRIHISRHNTENNTGT